MFASNLAPDVIFINNLNIPVYEKYLLDLNDIVKNKEDYYPQVLDTMTYEDRLLAIPRDVSTLVVFYNKDLFDKNNLSYPNENWNMTEFLDTAKKLTNNGIYGISFEENSLFYLPYMRAFGGGILSPTGEQIMNSENSQKGIQYYSDLRNKYNIAPKKYQSASETMAQMFINGRLAMHLSGRWLVPKYREDIKFDWDIVNFPNINEKSSVTLDSSGYAITKSSKHKEDAVKLVMFAFENGNQGDLFVQKAPGATIQTLAEAIKKYKNSDAPIKIIGTRHGEKDHEVLVTREEMSKAEDMGNYFRIPMDNRNLNYDKFYTDGDGSVKNYEAYTSNNTNQLDVDGMIELLKKMGEIEE